MLKADRISEERRTQYLSMVNEQSNRLARLVDDLMQVSRIDAHRVRLECRSLDIGMVARALVDQFRTKWADRDIEVDADQEATVTADPHKVEEILINLIDNAIKYSPAGTPVGVAVRSSPDEVVISVRDRGAGIAPHELSGLFQKFHRLLGPSTAEIPGTGLGLYIVKGLVEAQGGRVWVDSEVGSGSTFTFTLPLASQDSSAESGRARASRAGAKVGA
jgi:signal transduction histidine kinase